MQLVRLPRPSHCHCAFAWNLRIAKGENFPDFPKDNVRQACNTKKLPVVFVYYQSDRGFTGTDTAVVEILFPSGNLRTVSYAISVRP